MVGGDLVAEQRENPGVDDVVRYDEGVLVGYRWFDDRHIEPAFAFGHGLSYTDFELGDVEVATTDRGLDVSLDVANVGTRSGKAVPQVYVSMPDGPGHAQPPRQLKGFDSVELAAGTSRTVRVPLDARAFSYWDTGMHRWRVAEGCYGIDVGTSSQFSALVTLDIPLFAGFGDRAARRQAQAQLDTAEATTADLRSQVELEVWQAYQNLRTAAVTLDTTAAQLRSAQQAVDVTQARYRSGLATVLDVLSTQATLATARVQQVQARLDWAAGRATLGHAVGGLEPTRPVRNQEEMP